LPQGLTAPPYPSDTRIQDNRIDIPGGAAQRVWLEARMGGWGWMSAYLCNGGSEHNSPCQDATDCPGADCGQVGLLNWWEVVVDPASFANGEGADLQMPQIACDVEPVCDICRNELGACSCYEDVCETAFIQHDHPDRVRFDLEFAGFWEKLGLYCAGTQVTTPPAVDEGLDYYGGTYVIDVPQNARGMYVVDFRTGDATLFQLQDNITYYHDDTTPATINVCDPGACGARRTRFLSILPPLGPGGVPGEFAIRVSPLVMPQFSSFNGAIRWAGPPAEYVDAAAAGTTFTASRLGCEPYVQDWSAIGVLELFGPEVVPGSFYEIRFGDAACALSGDESCLSPAAYIWTAAWGDVVNDGGTQTPNFEDINAVIDSFRGLPSAVGTIRSKLHGNILDPSAPVSFQDIFHAVNAFRGIPYPYAGPTACPSEIVP